MFCLRCFACRPVSLATQTILHDGSSAIDAVFAPCRSPLSFLVHLVVPAGELTVNCLDAYGGFLSVLTAVTAFDGRSRITPAARAEERLLRKRDSSGQRGPGHRCGRCAGRAGRR